MGQARIKKLNGIKPPKRTTHPDGSVTIPITPRMKKVPLEAKQRFVEKFGREPGPDDPVIFDPDADTPQPLSSAKLYAGVVEAAKIAGVDPERAIKGLLGAEALAEYRSQH